MIVIINPNRVTNGIWFVLMPYSIKRFIQHRFIGEKIFLPFGNRISAEPEMAGGFGIVKVMLFLVIQDLENGVPVIRFQLLIVLYFFLIAFSGNNGIQMDNIQEINFFFYLK